MITGLDHIQIAMPRGKEPAARAFYSELLGLRELPKPPQLVARGGCWFSGPGLVLHLGVEEPFVAARKAHPAFRVADLDACQAEELRQLSEQLEARVAAQTEQILVGEREGATIAERARLAREIHDTLAQGLTGIVMQLGAAQRALAVALAAADEHLDLAGRMARESLAEARRSVWNLRSADLDRGDLGDALSGLAERQARIGATALFQQHE